MLPTGLRRDIFRFKAKGTAYKRHNHQLPLEESLSYFLLEGYSLSASPTSPPHTCDSEWSGQLLKRREIVTLLGET